MAKTVKAAEAATAATPVPKKPFSLTPVYWTLFLIYTVLVCYGTSNHEPWRDEAQSWLLCRDLSFSGLFKILPQEGHPPLWYLLILPMAKGGAPYMLQNYLSAAIMIGTAWLLLFRTVLPVYLKVTLLFSYFFLYQYAEFARSYCLMAFFCTLIIALYPSRFSRPWLFSLAVVGLFNTQMLTFTLAAGITALFAFDALQQRILKGKILAAFAVMCVGGAYLIPYIVMGSDTAKVFGTRIRDHWAEMSKAMGNAFFTNLDPTYGIIAFAAICICLVSRPKALLVLLCGVAGVFYILGYKYFGSIRHQGMLMLAALTAIGVGYYYKDDRWNLKTAFNGPRIAAIVLSLTLLAQIKTGFEVWSQDNDEVFSDAKGAAEYITEHHLEHATIVGHRSYVASAMLPFLPRDTRILFAECQRIGTYMIYDSCHFNNMYLPHDYAAYIADTMFFKPGRKPAQEVVLVMSGPIEDPQLAQDWQLAYRSAQEPMQHDEEFFIYRRK